MSLMRKLLCCLVWLAAAALALPASATGFSKPFSLRVSVPPGQTTAPFIVQAQITNESILPFQSLNVFVVSGATIVGVNKEVDTFALFPHFSFPLPPFAKMAFSGSSISITKDPMLWGETLTLTIAVNSCGDAQWSAAAWTGLQLNGESFTLDLAHSALTYSIPCGAPLVAGTDFTVPNSLNPDCVTGHRGYYDKDGSHPANSLDIFVTDTVPTNNQLNFRWLDVQAGGDPLATFEYDVCASGTLNPAPEPPDVSNIQVAWLDTFGNPASEGGPPAYIHAQLCLAPDQLPAPYGTFQGFESYDGTSGSTGFTAYTGSGAAYIAIDTTNPPRQSPVGTPPGSINYPGIHPGDPSTPGTQFDVVIDTERITVQLVCLDNDSDSGDTADCTETGEKEGTALQVVARGVGGTMMMPHSAGALVMSTPLPLITAAVLPNPNPANYVVGNQALMCVADRFNEEGGGHATTFIDIGGDGHVQGP